MLGRGARARGRTGQAWLGKGEAVQGQRASGGGGERRRRKGEDPGSDRKCKGEAEKLRLSLNSVDLGYGMYTILYIHPYINIHTQTQTQKYTLTFRYIIMAQIFASYLF